MSSKNILSGYIITSTCLFIIYHYIMSTRWTFSFDLVNALCGGGNWFWYVMYKEGRFK